MFGGRGNDTYTVDDSQDLVRDEAGIDVVNASVDFDLSARGTEIEVLNLQGLAISGTGNALDNTINGTEADNVLGGGAGNDVFTFSGALTGSIEGGAGDDTFTDAVDGVKRGAVITVAVTAIEDGGDRVNSDSEDYRYNLRFGWTPNDTDEYAISYISQSGEKNAPYHTTLPIAQQYLEDGLVGVP
ncbi:MAG: hypothetical protein HC895_23340, partial [Leptolyngbyaceae cyanobacterium SM1_3_5]|nr:hypothetical protein [Leptolyngbyaceae cyanobacterium SM1_3_5]